jgi:sulfur dioxygenase
MFLHPQLLVHILSNQLCLSKTIICNSKLPFRYKQLMMSTTTQQALGLRQLFDEDSSTYTYLIWDPATKDGVLVDPVDLQVDRDINQVRNLGLNLLYGINTHAHADHITGTYLLKQTFPTMKSIIATKSTAKADIHIDDGDHIEFGSRHLEVRATPGHTNGCVSYVADDKSFVLTGDALLIKGCGRTDFQGGSSATLYDSVTTKLFTLPDETIVYPAHDYNGRTQSTIGDEKKTNPRLGIEKTKIEFIEIMKNLNLPYPKRIDAAVPANLRCGVPDIEET